MENKLYFVHLYFIFLTAGPCASMDSRIYKAKEYSFINFGKEIYGKRLNDNLLKTATVKSEMDCQMECVIHQLCLSYNFGPFRQGNGYSCELNSADRFSKRDDFTTSTGFVYRGVWVGQIIEIITYVVVFVFVRSGRPNRIGSGQFSKWKNQTRAPFFPLQIFKLPDFGRPERENWASLIHEQGKCGQTQFWELVRFI